LPIRRYTDYDGPTSLGGQPTTRKDNEHIDDEDEDDPLRVGMWLEGDSLAPPCGSSISVVHSLIDLAFESVQEDEEDCVLYDLGCGDGRVCLEAYWRYMNDDKSDRRKNSQRRMQCVGVEIEDDLIIRFRELIGKLQPPPTRVDEGGREDGSDQSVTHSSRIHAVKGDLCEVLKSLVDRQKKLRVVDEKMRANNNEGEASPYEYLPLPTIITMYLLPESITLIEPTLLEMMSLNPKLIIICNSWGMRKSVSPAKTVNAIDGETGLTTTLFLYTAESLGIS